MTEKDIPFSPTRKFEMLTKADGEDEPKIVEGVGQNSALT